MLVDPLGEAHALTDRTRDERVTEFGGEVSEGGVTVREGIEIDG